MRKTDQNPRQKPRKSLRDRVADRKAGIKEEIDPRRVRILKRVKLFANLAQGIGLLMLLVVLARYINSSINRAYRGWRKVHGGGASEDPLNRSELNDLLRKAY